MGRLRCAAERPARERAEEVADSLGGGGLLANHGQSGPTVADGEEVGEGLPERLGLATLGGRKRLDRKLKRLQRQALADRRVPLRLRAEGVQ